MRFLNTIVSSKKNNFTEHNQEDPSIKLQEKHLTWAFLMQAAR